jgi:hypothetical protein
MMTSYTGDYSLNNLILTTVNEQQYDLRFVMSEINVYEDLWNNQTTCDIFVTDAKNMIQNLPIFGFETLLLEFNSPNKNVFSKTFRLVRITDRKLIKDRQAGYILHFVTPEAVSNLKVRVSKSYKGKLISDIVNDLHKNWLNSDTYINVEPTIYQQHIIIPKLNPCHAINWLATRANSALYEGATYLYYEDKDQFNFVTMESRLAQPSSLYYTFQIANIRKDGLTHHAEDLAANIIAIQTYSFKHYSDILENLQTGMYGNELITHSQSRKIWRDYQFDYPDSFNDYQHLYASNLLFDPIFNDDTPNSRLKLHSTGPDLDGYPFQPELWIPCRVSQLQQLQNIKVAITVPGDSERTVGQVVELRIPSPEPPIGVEQVEDKYYNGRFLIQSVRHKIDVEKYMTDMELVKDSTLVAYP